MHIFHPLHASNTLRPSYPPWFYHHSLLGSCILLKTLFSNTFNMYSSLMVRDHISHPYKTIDKIVGLYAFIFKLSDKRWGNKSCWIWW
jgi:hypothetical protein